MDRKIDVDIVENLVMECREEIIQDHLHLGDFDQLERALYHFAGDVIKKYISNTMKKDNYEGARWI